MPQGKGTYGSQVGRPPKKKKYQSGGSIDPFSEKNPEGIAVEKGMEAIEEQNAMPTTNAMDRSQVSPMGEEVGTGMYKKGGKVDVTDIVKDVKILHGMEGAHKELTKSMAGRSYNPYTTTDISTDSKALDHMFEFEGALRRGYIKKKKKGILKGKKKK